jgi:hypothetical protein
MSRPRTTLSAAALLLAVVAFAPAQAQPVPGLVFEPPYVAGTWSATSGIGPSCTQARSRWSGTTVRPDATAGRLDLSIGLAATRCSSYLDERWLHSWEVGNTLPVLVGQPAHVILTMTVEQIRTVQRGRGQRSATFSLAVGDPRPARDSYHDVAAILCATSCATDLPVAGTVDLSFELPRLPAKLFLGVRRQAFVTGTAEIGLLLKARLQQVRVEPALVPSAT